MSRYEWQMEVSVRLAVGTVRTELLAVLSTVRAVLSAVRSAVLSFILSAVLSAGVCAVSLERGSPGAMKGWGPACSWVDEETRFPRGGLMQDEHPVRGLMQDGHRVQQWGRPRGLVTSPPPEP